MEEFIPLNGSAGNSAPVTSLIGGKRRSHKKLRVVKKKTVRKMLKNIGLKMRGGAAGGEVTANKVVNDKDSTGVVIPPDSTSGGKRRHTKKSHRRRSLFGMKY
jgi:hypothetical protein